MFAISGARVGTLLQRCAYLTKGEVLSSRPYFVLRFPAAHLRGQQSVCRHELATANTMPSRPQVSDLGGCLRKQRQKENACDCHVVRAVVRKHARLPLRYRPVGQIRWLSRVTPVSTPRVNTEASSSMDQADGWAGHPAPDQHVDHPGPARASSHPRILNERKEQLCLIGSTGLPGSSGTLFPISAMRLWIRLLLLRLQGLRHIRTSWSKRGSMEGLSIIFGGARGCRSSAQHSRRWRAVVVAYVNRKYRCV